MNSALELAEKLARKARVLVVNDERHMQVLVSRCLDNLGCSCVVASSGEEALGKISEEDFDLILFDLILGDTRLPVVSGIDILKTIRERQVRTPVVIVTGFPQDVVEVFLKEMEVVGVMVKPFSCTELCQRVRRLFDLYKIHYHSPKLNAAQLQADNWVPEDVRLKPEK
jgi:DNA-binding response OmpR family regulator